MTTLTRTARALAIAAFSAIALATVHSAHATTPRRMHTIYFSNTTSQCAWVTITYMNDQSGISNYWAQSKSLGAREGSGPLWVAGTKVYKFEVDAANRMKVRAEVQAKDCPAHNGKWDTGSMAGGNVYDTVGEIPGVSSHSMTVVTLKKGNGNYFPEFKATK